MLLTPFIGAGTAVVLYELLKRLGLDTRVAGWTVAGFLFGTVHWLMIREPLDSYFSHLVAVGLVFLALEAAAARRSGVLIGLCALAVMMNKNAMGGWQINGVRYALDFLPVLLIFAARGMAREAHTPYRVIWQGAIVYSIVLNLLALAIHYAPKIMNLLAG